MQTQRNHFMGLDEGHLDVGDEALEVLVVVIELAAAKGQVVASVPVDLGTR